MSGGVLVVGEALMDCVVRPNGDLQPLPGGAAFNLARAMARQSLRVRYINPISGDLFGQRLRGILVADGVQLPGTPPSSRPTSMALVSLQADGSATYSFYREAIADREVWKLDPSTLIGPPDIRVAATTGLALDPSDSPALMGWLRSQAKAGRILVVDANLRPAVFDNQEAYRKSVWNALSVADVIKASDEDLQLLHLNSTDPAELAAALFERTQVSIIAITLGAKGAHIFRRELPSVGMRETTPLRIKDTIGAGDSFLGTLISWLSQQPSKSGGSSAVPRLSDTETTSLLHRCIAAGALACETEGCNPPSTAEIDAFIAQRSAPVRL